MTNPHLTIAQLARDILHPMMMRGIERGDYDEVLSDMLADHASGEFKFSDEVLRAMISRAYIVCTSKPKFTVFDGDGGKIGAQLKIKLPPNDWIGSQ